MTQRPSERELQVIEELAEGYSPEQIALRLQISGETVKTHLKNLRRKLEARNTLHAVVKCLRKGWIQ